MQIMRESPLFTRTHDLVLWLLQATRSFRREQRFVMAQRLIDSAFALQDSLIASNRDKTREATHLIQADIHLTSLRKSLLLCLELGLLTPGQYRHVSQIDSEVGKLLGAMRKRAEEKKGP